MNNSRLIDDLITQAESLKEQPYNSIKGDFTEWQQMTKAVIKRLFVDHAEKIKDFESISYRPGVTTNLTPKEVWPNAYEKGLNQAIGLLNALKYELKLSVKDDISEKPNAIMQSNTCFIVHGHNNEIKLEVKDFVTAELKLRPIVLHQKPNEGKTVLEKFEKHADVDFAVCVWSADDEGNEKGSSITKLRARQNVIIETGFFWGKLGRDRVIVLLEDGVEIPSDYAGMLYIKYSGNWMEELRREVTSIYQKS